MAGRTMDLIDSPVCYSDFYEQYLVANKPCLLSQAFSSHWPCRQLWLRDGRPDWEHLKSTYGSSICPVADCGQESYNTHPKSEWRLEDYINYLTEYRQLGYPASMPCLYLKDWHFPQNFPLSPIYEVPPFFSSDWLNEDAVVNETDDYRFVYIGPKGSWTPLHCDVYGSFSWSANIAGRKRWILIPAGEETKLATGPSHSLPNSTSIQDLQSADVPYIEIFQNAGEIIFVPSGWYHQVWNLEDTISVNHNWFNAANINFIDSCLLKALQQVQDELRDFAIDDHEQADVILRCHHGMNCQDFRALLQRIINRRKLSLAAHCQCCHSQCTNQLCSRIMHAEYDLNAARGALNRKLL